MITIDQIFKSIYIDEIGEVKHKELYEIDKLFHRILYVNESKQDDIKDIVKIQKYFKKIFNVRVEIEMRYVGSYENITVLPMLKKSINYLEKEHISISDCLIIFTIINFDFIRNYQLKGSEVTAIMLHEFGHVENSLSKKMRIVNHYIQKIQNI